MGLLAIVLAWVIGVYSGHLPLREVTAGFPIDLFLTLAGVTLLFSQARVNGTLDIVAHNAVRLCRGRVGLVPDHVFRARRGARVSRARQHRDDGAARADGDGHRAADDISPFLMAIMVGNGCNSGSLSPLAPTGIIVTGLMKRIGLGGHEIYVALQHAGARDRRVRRIFDLRRREGPLRRTASRCGRAAGAAEPPPVLTLGMIAVLILGVIFGGFNIGMAAFAAAVLLSLLRAADDGEAIKKMPWSTILMVCGVTVLIGLLEKTGGMEIFTNLLVERRDAGDRDPVLGRHHRPRVARTRARRASCCRRSCRPCRGSSRSSAAAMRSSIASTMNIAGHLVDVSPLSTIGALCIAGVPAGEQSRKLFNQLLAWGLSMTVVGALLCWILFA